ncbi:hypothetical protein TNCV_1485421 [Trichonephila clavipes]|nr:hypothetical protein TNCV_1485421 [Trichonephila clavipes]
MAFATWWGSRGRSSCRGRPPATSCTAPSPAPRPRHRSGSPLRPASRNNSKSSIIVKMLYSPKNWEFRTICQLATCDDHRPCIGHGLPTIPHHYSFSQKAAVGQDEEQNLRRMSASMYHLMRYHETGNQFLSRIIAADELRCHYFDTATKRVTMEWRHPLFPRTKKARSSIGAGKVVRHEPVGAPFLRYLRDVYL